MAQYAFQPELAAFRHLARGAVAFIGRVNLGLEFLELLFAGLDPLLQPLFGAGQPQHVDHLTWFTAESFGGPDRFSEELGFSHLIDVHRGLRITEAQRRRFAELYRAALELARTYRVTGEQLTLFRAGGTIAATFDRARGLTSGS